MKLEKTTKIGHRNYDDACGAAHALDLVGERWALLVMRELLLGPRRFGDLRAGLPGISANVLTQRLEGLEASGVVERRRLPPPASAQVYGLTAWGLECEPILQALGRWAARSPTHDPSLPLSTASLLISLRTMLDPARASGLVWRVGFRFGAETYRGLLKDGSIAIEPGAIGAAEFVLAGPARALAAAIYGGVPLESLEAQGALAVEGDRELAARFTTLFPLPPKVARIAGDARE